MTTVEEKNVVIAKFMGCSMTKKDRWFISMSTFVGYMTTNNLYFNSSWEWLMPVWIRLKDELRNCMLPDSGDIGATAQHLLEWTKSYVSEGDIKAAHQYTYEAIEWLNQNKEK